jgi:hypothetical protein
MTIPEIRTLTWTEIELAPERAGVYAWYSRLRISKADIQNVVSQVSNAKDEQEARVAIEQALDRFVFNPYRESPYRVLLRGQLKPKFSGDVQHEPSRSDSLVTRLAKNPQRLNTVAELLSTAAPAFTSPLYIGMATNLRNRLRTHKNKITEFRDQRTEADGDSSPEAGFARQVVARGFDPTNLFVHVAEIDVDTGEHNDIENILNRINYPIFGRN